MTTCLGEGLYIRFTVHVQRESLSVFLCTILHVLILRVECEI